MGKFFGGGKPKRDPELERLQREQAMRLQQQEENLAKEERLQEERSRREQAAQRRLGGGVAALLAKGFSGFKLDGKDNLG